jgi:hypothetical protein
LYAIDGYFLTTKDKPCPGNSARRQHQEIVTIDGALVRKLMFIKIFYANFVRMKKSFFKLLARVNKVILPRYSQRDITRLSKLDKALVAYRYWVTLNSLD